MSRFYSNATWENIDNSADDHKTFDQANDICMRLITEYDINNPCEIRGVRFKSWVTNENGEVLKEYNMLENL